MEDKQTRQLKELQTDFFTTLFSKPKSKRKRPLVRQITHNGITKKWLEDGKGNFIDFVGKPKYAHWLLMEENETPRQFVVRLIDEGYFK